METVLYLSISPAFNIIGEERAEIVDILRDPILYTTLPLCCSVDEYDSNNFVFSASCLSGNALTRHKKVANQCTIPRSYPSIAYFPIQFNDEYHIDSFSSSQSKQGMNDVYHKLKESGICWCFDKRSVISLSSLGPFLGPLFGKVAERYKDHP